MSKKLEVIKKLIPSPCYICHGKDKNCKSCNGTGFYVESLYYHICKGKNGKKYAIDGDTLK